MCGISGFYSKASSLSEDIISKMSQALKHRGPDNSGVWINKNSGIYFGHQRLSILDLSDAGHQPMQSQSSRFIITYNGEIYNHLDIRKELERNNFKIEWKGNSDTETLLEAINFFGVEQTLSKIEGMFAFGLWDQKMNRLFLARDRLGEKPLYYGWQGVGDNKVFIFGSELKALKVHPEFRGNINRDAISLQLRHNCIPAPYSIYKDIYKLQPGHFLELKESDLKKKISTKSKNYWSLSEIAISGNNSQFNQCEEEIEKNLEKNLQLSVKKQMISDVPLGAFLSGGVDSTLIVALMQSQAAHPVNTFTIGFDQDDFSEARYAKKIARHLGTNHRELNVTPNQVIETIPKIPSIYDEPFSDSSQIPTFLISQFANQNVKVALSGDGGDELFCGYNRYMMSTTFSNLQNYTPLILRKILAGTINSISPRNWNRISKVLPGLNKHLNFGEKIHKFANVLKTKSLQDYYYTLCSHWQNPDKVLIDVDEPKTTLKKLISELDGLNIQQQMMVMDSITYLSDDILVKLDRAAMASSLETRAPFLDHKLIEHVWKIPHSLKIKNGKGKFILRQILDRYVPNALTERPKMGFGIPLAEWLRGPLKDWAENLLDEKILRHEGYFNSELIKNKWKEHLTGKKNWQYDLWDVLMFQAWINENK